MPIKFSDRSIKGLKAKSSPYEKNGGDGFMLRVSTKGTKVFRFKYCVKGKPKFVAIGRFSLFSFVAVSLLFGLEHHYVFAGIMRG